MAPRGRTGGLGASGCGSRGSRRQQGLSLPQGPTSLGFLDVPRMHPGSCPLPKQIQNGFPTFLSFNQCSDSPSCFPGRKNNTHGTPQTQRRGAWTTAPTHPSPLTQTSLRCVLGEGKGSLHFRHEVIRSIPLSDGLTHLGESPHLPVHMTK